MQTHDIDTEDDRTATLQARSGRDAGKTFRIHEVPPLDMATYVLRLLSALRSADMDALLAFLRPRAAAEAEAEAEESDLKGVLAMLTGCDALAVRALIVDALAYVQVAPDPQRPGMFRKVDPALDIKEMATLGQLLGVFARTNISPPG